MKNKWFKQEFNTLAGSVDPWFYGMEAMFECVEHMYMRGLNIPEEWGYDNHFSVDRRDEDSIFYPYFINATNEELDEIGHFLWRYTRYLKFKEVDY